MKNKIISIEKSYCGEGEWGYDDVILDDGTEITLRQKPNHYHKVGDIVEVNRS